MQRVLIAAGALLACAFIACSSAFADSLTSQSLTLDTYSPAHTNDAGPVSTIGTLDANKLYVVKVQGTWSAWVPALWTGHVFRRPAVRCGTPESAPMFPSPNGFGTGPVGQDAETVFAAIEIGFCQRTYPHEYNKGTGFLMNLGSGFQHYAPFGGDVNTPSPDHSYTYILAGQGGPISFEQKDRNTTDNYGEYHITVTLGTDACGNGGWQTFGSFTSQADCVAYFAGNPASSAPTTSPPTASVKACVVTAAALKRNVIRNRRRFVVSGVGITKVVFRLNGRVIKTLSRPNYHGKFMATVATSMLRFGSSRLTAKVSEPCASQVKAASLVRRPKPKPVTAISFTG